jgi:PleD family two-component response regulator
MNVKDIIVGGSDLQFIDILSQNIKNFNPELEIQTTNDAYEMYLLTREKKPEILISELIFPQWDWDGYLILKLIKKDSRLSSIPVFLILDKREPRYEYIIQDEEIDKVVFKTDGLDVILQEIKKMI